MDELLQKAPSNWYIEAQEAKALGLVEDVILRGLIREPTWSVFARGAPCLGSSGALLGQP